MASKRKAEVTESEKKVEPAKKKVVPQESPKKGKTVVEEKKAAPLTLPTSTVVDEIEEDDKETESKIDHTEEKNKLIVTLCEFFGIQNPEKNYKQILMAIKEEQKKLFKSYTSIGENICLNPTEYVKKGIKGLFDYVKKTVDMDLPLMTMAFPIDMKLSVNSDVQVINWLKKNNLFKLKNYKLGWDLILARTRFFRMLVNTALYNFEKGGMLDKFEENWTEVEALKKIFTIIFNSEKMESYKYFERVKTVNNNSENKFNGGGGGGYNNNRNSSSMKGEQITTKVPIFRSENPFEECWKTIQVYWISPFEDHIAKSKGLSKPISKFNVLDYSTEKHKIETQGYFDITLD